MRLTTHIAYAPQEDDMNLGEEYNRLMEAARTEWVCFLDHDATWLRADWNPTIVQHIEQHQERAGLLTCPATRIGLPRQRWRNGELQGEHNIKSLRKLAAKTTNDYQVVESTTPISGVVMVTSRTAWKAAGGFRPGFLGVDNEYHRAVEAAGLETHILEGVPVYHWYRGDRNHAHLRKANRLWHNYHP
jgi:GT2 family glycosyltransferase